MTRPTLTEYDGLDRVTKTTLSDGSVQSVLYDVTDGGEPYTRTSDPLGNMSVRRTDPAGNIIYVERQDKAGKKLTWAVKEGIRRGILPGYLERKASKVVNMLTMEYNYADDVVAQREESLAEGMRLGEEKGRVETIRLMMGNMNLTFAQVMDALKIEPSERDRLASLL